MYHTKYKTDICVDCICFTLTMIQALKLTRNGRNILPE